MMVEVPGGCAPLEARHDRSLLRVQARWILTVTVLTVLSACLLSWALSDTAYPSEARLLVNPALTPGGTPLAPDMETERQVAVSRVVTAEAARTTGETPGRLQRHLSTSVPPDSTVLVLRYTDTTAARAHDRAQAVADAYLAYRAPQAALLSPATLPRAADGPDYLLNGAAGLAVGVLLGVGSALLRDRLDDSVRGPRDLTEHAHLPVLATVSAADDGGSRAYGAGADQRIVVLEDPDSRDAETFRQLRRKVSRAAESRQATTTVTVLLGAAADDGAGQVAVNTAAALARGGAAVLLVEADLRNPRPAALFDVPAGPGLAGVLAGEVLLPDAVRDSGVGGLRVLPAGGTAVPAPGELFDDLAVERLIGAIPADVEHVVLHVPPILGAAETATLAEHASVVVLVVTVGQTGRQDVGAALTELGDARAAVLGAVLRDRAGRDRHRVRRPRGTRSAAPGRPTPEDDGHAGGRHSGAPPAVAARPQDASRDRITHAG